VKIEQRGVQEFKTYQVIGFPASVPVKAVRRGIAMRRGPTMIRNSMEELLACDVRTSEGLRLDVTASASRLGISILAFDFRAIP
jgi:hypothetical protein